MGFTYVRLKDIASVIRAKGEIGYETLKFSAITILLNLQGTNQTGWVI